MLTIRVEAVSGHYRVPGNVEQSGIAPTFAVAPPSTVRGFLESLCGSTCGSFEGEFAYGWLRDPQGYGLLHRRVQVWASGGMKPRLERNRTINVEMLFDVAYAVAVRGPWADRVRAALEGDVERFGVLYLGESTDLVTWIAPLNGDASNGVRWVVPGTSLRLPVVSGRGYDSITAAYGTFDIREGEPAWHH